MNTKLIPFDPDKAKNGAKVVTRNGLPVRIGFYDLKGGEFPIAGAVKEKNNTEAVRSFTMKGRHYPYDKDSPYDLFIEEEEQEKPRREYSGTDSIYVPKDDEGISEELIDAINGLWDNDALPMPLSIKRKDAWITWLQKQCGEKPADNTPKFHEGDWVVLNPGCNAHRIIRVVENATSHTYGYDTADGYYFNDTVEGVRHWNINDAKEGDVLCSTGLHNDCIFIFNGLGNWKFDAEGDRTVATGYCCLFITADKMEFGIQGPDCIEVNTIKPATKVQRNLLFQKIKEKGYEWNSDTKELKKIDAFPAEKKIKTRRMTNQELSWWLRDCPHERREVCREDEDTIYSRYIYRKCDADEEVPEFVRIRRNGGEWMEPLIEE